MRSSAHVILDSFPTATPTEREGVHIQVREFLKFVTRSRTHAAGTAVLGLLLPPFGFVAAGMVGLVTLKYGVADGALILAASVAVSSAVMLLVFHSADAALLFTVSMGLPMLIVAGVLRITASQGTALASAGLLGGSVIAAVHLLTADPVAWWRGVLETFLVDRIARGNTPDPAMVESLRGVSEKLAPLMSGAPTGIAIGTMVLLFLARWGHALLDNPGGFGKEFRALRLNRRVAFAALVLGLGAIVFRGFASGLLPELFKLVVALYVIQGIAVAHALVRHRHASSAWLAAMYILVVLMPPLAMILLSVTGFSDSWINYRRRYGGQT